MGIKENGGWGDWGGVDKFNFSLNERGWIGNEINV